MNANKTKTIGMMLKIIVMSIFLSLSLAGSPAFAWGHPGGGWGHPGGGWGHPGGGWGGGWGPRYYGPSYGYRPYVPRTYIVPLPQVFPRYYSYPYYYPYSYGSYCHYVWDGYDYEEVCN